MGAAACSDSVQKAAADVFSAPISTHTSTSQHGSRALSSASDARRWHLHEKMQMSPASQAVFEGAQRGDARHVVNALNVKGDPNCVSASGYTALMLAVGGGFKDVAALLLQAKGDPNGAVTGVTPLMIAAAAGQVELARMLVNTGADGRLPDEMNGRSALHRACQRGHLELVHLLLRSGAPQGAGDWANRTPLMLATEGGHAEVVRALLRALAEAAVGDSEGKSALARCVVGGHDGCLDLMLQSGTPVNAVNKLTGDSALMVGARVGAIKLCRRLLEFSASVNLRNQQKETALMLAAEGGQAELTRTLLLAAADTTLQDLRGHTPLMRAAAGGNPSVVSVMLDFKASPSAASPLDLSSPLTVAARHGHAQVYNILVNAGSAVAPIEDGLGHYELSGLQA